MYAFHNTYVEECVVMIYRQYTFPLIKVICSVMCCLTQILMSVLTTTEHAVQTLTAPIHLEALHVLVWKDIRVTD